MEIIDEINDHFIKLSQQMFTCDCQYNIKDNQLQ